MNSKSRKKLLLNLSDKISFKKSNSYVALSNISIYYTWVNRKSHTNTINLIYQPQREMINLNYFTGNIFCIRYLRLF